ARAPSPAGRHRRWASESDPMRTPVRPAWVFEPGSEPPCEPQVAGSAVRIDHVPVGRAGPPGRQGTDGGGRVGPRVPGWAVAPSAAPVPPVERLRRAPPPIEPGGRVQQLLVRRL